MKKEKVFKVRNLKSGVIYFIGEKKLRKEAGDWEILTSDKVEAKDDKGEYQALKDELTEMGIPFKGNASKETLKQLLEMEKDSLN